MNPENTSLRPLITAAFEGNTLTLIEYKGAPSYIANEVGAALGYAGRRLVTNIGGKWAGEFREGEHYHHLAGPELALLREVVTDSVTTSKFAPSLLLLTEAGLYRVLMLTGKPAGLRLRDWLDSEVLPSIARTGGYGAPAIGLSDADVARIAAATPSRSSRPPRRSPKSRPMRRSASQLRTWPAPRS